MSEIKGKVVAITGASSGIGEATALVLAERGAKVVLGARGSGRLAALVERIVGSGGDAATHRRTFGAVRTSPLSSRSLASGTASSTCSSTMPG